MVATSHRMPRRLGSMRPPAWTSLRWGDDLSRRLIAAAMSASESHAPAGFARSARLARRPVGAPRPYPRSGCDGAVADRLARALSGSRGGPAFPGLGGRGAGDRRPLRGGAGRLVPQGGNSRWSAVRLRTRRQCFAIVAAPDELGRSVSPQDNVAVAEAGVILSTFTTGGGGGAPVPALARRQGLGDGRRAGLDQCGRDPGARFGPMRSLVVGLEASFPTGRCSKAFGAPQGQSRLRFEALLIGAEGTLESSPPPA